MNLFQDLITPIFLIQKLKNKLKRDIHLSDLLKGSAITLVLKMGGMSLSYILLFLISRKIGAEGVGFYQVMVQILTVLGMVFGLGFNISVLRYVGQFNNDESRPKMHVLYKYFVSSVAPLTIIAGISIYFGADYIISWAGKEQEYAGGLKIIGLVLPFFTLNQISVEFIRGLKKLQISELIRSVLRPSLMILGVLLFFWGSLGKMDVIYLLCAGLIINSTVARWAIWNELKIVPKTVVSFQRKELLKTSYPMWVTGLASSLLMAVPIIFLDLYRTQAEVGIYSIAFKLASTISLVLVVVNTIAAPKFAELFWNDKIPELQKIITQSTKMTFWMAFIFSIILIGGGKFILTVFGEEFKSGYWVMVILLIGQLLNAATGSVSLFLNMSGNQKVIRNIYLFAIILFIPGYYLIIPIYGMEGATFLFLGEMVIINVSAALFVFRNLGIKTFYCPFFNLKN